MDAEVRTAEERDVSRLNDIYNHFVTTGAVTFDTRPSSLAERMAWYSQFGTAGPHRLLVAESSGSVAGYAGSMSFRVKPAYETSVETTIYLAPGFEGRGLGTRLYRALFDALALEDLHRAYAGITLPNAASIRFHERFGFQRVGLYREVGRKHDRYWDVAWYEKALP